MIFYRRNKIKPGCKIMIDSSSKLPIQKIRDQGYEIVYPSSKKIDEIDYYVIQNDYVGHKYLNIVKHLDLITTSKKSIAFITDIDLYKSTMYIDFNLELYNQINDLLKPDTIDSSRIALELMSKIKWNRSNKFYLAMLCRDNKYSVSSMRSHGSVNIKYFISNFIDSRWEYLIDLPDFENYGEGLLTRLEHYKFITESRLSNVKQRIEGILNDYSLGLKTPLNLYVYEGYEEQEINEEIELDYSKIVLDKMGFVVKK